MSHMIGADPEDASADATRGIEVGVLPGEISSGTARLRAILAEVEDAGLDFVAMGDHVSFRGGFGVDGLVAASAMLAAHPTLRVATGVYLLPLRHPVAVARQISTIAALAPGRFTFGVGLGGEDPAELRSCGIDPQTRGRRMNECLTVLLRSWRRSRTSRRRTRRMVPARRDARGVVDGRSVEPPRRRAVYQAPERHHPGGSGRRRPRHECGGGARRRHLAGSMGFSVVRRRRERPLLSGRATRLVARARHRRGG